MATWVEFATDEPRLAEGIRGLMQQYGPGLGYLATVRPDGGPRVHPVSPVITDEGLFCFVIDSPKRRDLERDGRYALHSFPPEETDDEAYVAGRARPVTDPERVARIADSLRAAPHVDWRLFEFSVDVAMLTRRGSGGCGGLTAGTSAPDVRVWLDPTSARAPRPLPTARAGDGARPRGGVATGETTVSASPPSHGPEITADGTRSTR